MPVLPAGPYTRSAANNAAAGSGGTAGASNLPHESLPCRAGCRTNHNLRDTWGQIGGLKKPIVDRIVRAMKFETLEMGPEAKSRRRYIIRCVGYTCRFDSMYVAMRRLYVRMPFSAWTRTMASSLLVFRYRLLYTS